jgi:endonuclease/exonuclease/phosphatase family metal-dependent hydrolase
MLNSVSQYFAVLAILTGSIWSAWADNPAPLRVMSFNVRYSKALDGTNSWKKRQDYFFQVIDQFSPSLIGFQEVLADQYDAILSHMTNYSFTGVAREDGKRKGEWSLLGFRKERFEKLDAGDFWLSEHPEEIGSRSWDAALPRICTWARLRDRTAGREFLYANTHFDHKGHLAREKSAQLILTRLTAMAKGAPIILTGDFNITEDAKPYAVIARPNGNGSASLIDSYREVHPVRRPDEASFNGFKPVINGSRIDFIFHSAQLKATAATIERQRSPEGKFASDHYAVTAVLVFGAETR